MKHWPSAERIRYPQISQIQLPLRQSRDGPSGVAVSSQGNLRILVLANCLKLVERLGPGSAQPISLRAGLDSGVVDEQASLAFAFILKLHVHLGR